MFRIIINGPVWQLFTVGFLSLVYLGLFTLNSTTRWWRFTPDSMNYVNVAENYRDGRGLVQSTLGFNQPDLSVELRRGTLLTPLRMQTPLYPVVIAGVSHLGIPTPTAALLISAFCYAAILLLAAVLATSIFGGGSALASVSVLLALAPLTLAARTAWTEPLAVMILFLCLVLLVRSQGRTGIGMSGLAGLAAGLAFATRVAMAPLVAVGAMFLLLDGREMRWLRVLSFLAGALVGGGPALSRLIALGGLEMEREPSEVGLFRNLGRVLTSLTGRWLDVFPSGVETAISVFFVIGLLVILGRRSVLAGSLRGIFISRPGWLIPAWVVAYSAVLMLQCTIYMMDPISGRLMLPALAPLVLPLSALMMSSLRLGIRGGVLLLLVALVFACTRETMVLLSRRPHGAREEIEASERLRWIETTSPRDLIIGNEAVDVPFFFGRPAVSFSAYPRHRPVYEDVVAFAGRHCPEGGHNYLVLRDRHWDEASWRHAYGPFIADLVQGRLSAYPKIILRDRLEDGWAFEILCGKRQSEPPG